MILKIHSVPDQKKVLVALLSSFECITKKYCTHFHRCRCHRCWLHVKCAPQTTTKHHQFNAGIFRCKHPSRLKAFFLSKKRGKKLSSYFCYFIPPSTYICIRYPFSIFFRLFCSVDYDEKPANLANSAVLRYLEEEEQLKRQQPGGGKCLTFTIFYL